MIERFHFYQKKSKKICGNIFSKFSKIKNFQKKKFEQFFFSIFFQKDKILRMQSSYVWDAEAMFLRQKQLPLPPTSERPM